MVPYIEHTWWTSEDGTDVILLPAYRYSMVIVDNVIKSVNVEADGVGLSCSLANVILDQLKA